MRNETRDQFTRYAARIAELNGVDNATVQFSVSPSIQQTLENHMQLSSEFLSRINVVPVDELEGEKLGLGISGPIANRTDTSVKERHTKDPTSLDGRRYKCVKTDSDTHLTYGKLDLWAKFPDFQTRIRDTIVKRQALDRIMIGWNGVSAAVEHDPNLLLLEDLNKGWLQMLREDAPQRVMDEGGVAAGKIVVGQGGDYETLDALVYDMRQQLLAPWARNDSELVAIVGDDLLHDKYFPMINKQEAPTEQIARDLIMSTKRLGGIAAATVPFFVPGGVMVTRFDNLSIYYQDGKRRRALIDNPRRDRVENFESSNDAYVVEDYDYACFAENIELKA